MPPRSTADADGPTQRGGAAGRSRDAGRPVTLWLVAGVFALSGAMYLLTGDSALHATNESATVLTGIVLLVIAGGLWLRQAWAIVCAVVLQVFGLLLAYLTIDIPGVVVSIVLLGCMFAIPRHVWR